MKSNHCALCLLLLLCLTACGGGQEKDGPYGKSGSQRLGHHAGERSDRSRPAPDLTAIVREEAGAYLSGGKSLEDAVRLIKNRAGLYLSENQ